MKDLMPGFATGSPDGGTVSEKLDQKDTNCLTHPALALNS